MERFGLSDKNLEAIKAVLRKYDEIESVKIFGSRAKGNFKRYSDIDLALFGDFELKTLMEVRANLEELDVIYQFDVVHYESLKNEELQRHIDRVGVEI